MIGGRAGQELDNWITGHYGEDQFRGPHICEHCNVEFDSYGAWEGHVCPNDPDKESDEAAE